MAQTSYVVTQSPAPHMPADELTRVLNLRVAECTPQDLQKVLDALARGAGMNLTPSATIATLLP